MTASMTRLFVHFVWGTYQRHPWVVGSVRELAYKVVARKCQDNKAQVLALDGVEDHVHLLVKIAPDVAITKLIADIKGSSSHAINQEWPHDTFAWQDGYGAFTVSQSGVEAVHAYIRNQDQHHHAACSRIGMLDAPQTS